MISKLLRVNQWTKNFLVFAALVFARAIFDVENIKLAVWAFFSFSFLASSIYIINDIADIEKDRQHPVKKDRPIASGKINKSSAYLISVILFLLALAIAIYIRFDLVYLLLLYFVLNLAYSFKLKHIVILDVFIVAIGFALRVLYGALAISVEASHWILICTFMLALFLAFGKRRNELVLTEDSIKYRRVLDDYDKNFLDQMISVASASAIMTYILYTISPETVSNFQTDRLVYSSPFVLYAIYRYQYLIYKKNSGGDPTKTIMTDPWFIAGLIAWVISVIVILYFK